MRRDDFAVNMTLLTYHKLRGRQESLGIFGPIDLISGTTRLQSIVSKTDTLSAETTEALYRGNFYLDFDKPEILCNPLAPSIFGFNLILFRTDELRESVNSDCYKYKNPKRDLGETLVSEFQISLAREQTYFDLFAINSTTGLQIRDLLKLLQLSGVTWYPEYKSKGVNVAFSDNLDSRQLYFLPITNSRNIHVYPVGVVGEKECLKDVDFDFLVFSCNSEPKDLDITFSPPPHAIFFALWRIGLLLAIIVFVTYRVFTNRRRSQHP